MSSHAPISIAEEIEDAYVEIGRMVVQAAIEQARASAVSPDGGTETTIAVRVRFDPSLAEQHPRMCCICTCDTDGVWVCAGPCCPTRNSTW